MISTKDFFSGLFISIITFLGIILSTGLTAGGFYWMYLSYKLDSLGMFIFGMVFFPISTSLGFYSLIFVTPDWLIKFVI